MLIGILAMVALTLVFSEVTERITYNRIQKRIAYWESLVDKELPSGSSKERVEQWGRDHHLKFFELIPSKNFFDANVEQIPAVGIGFPCSDWNIIVDIYMGNDAKSIGRKVHTVGSCI
jgi:hypothetical protein